MIRGTNAQFRFKLPCEVNELTWVTVKFWQLGNIGSSEPSVSIVKDLKQCSECSNPNELSVTLTSKETAKFSDKFKLRVQVRGNANGNVFGSREELFTVYPLEKGIIEDGGEDLPAPEDDYIILDGKQIV